MNKPLLSCLKFSFNIFLTNFKRLILILQIWYYLVLTLDSILHVLEFMTWGWCISLRFHISVSGFGLIWAFSSFKRRFTTYMRTKLVDCKFQKFLIFLIQLCNLLLQVLNFFLYVWEIFHFVIKRIHSKHRFWSFFNLLSIRNWEFSRLLRWQNSC